MFPEPGSRPSPDPSSPSTSILGVHSLPALNLKFPFSTSVSSCPLRASELTQAMTHVTPYQISMKPLLLGTMCTFYKQRAENQLHASSGSKEVPLSREESQTHAGHHMTEAWADGHTLPIAPIHMCRRRHQPISCHSSLSLSSIMGSIYMVWISGVWSEGSG